MWTEINKGKGIPGQIWAFLNSMRVGIALLLALTGISVYAATFLEHRQAMEKVYTSWWFMGTLAITAASLLACSINRFPGIRKKIRVLKTDVSLQGLQALENKAEIAAAGPPENLEAILKGRGYRTGISYKDGKYLVSADKGRYGYLGSLVTHISLVLILAAGFYGMVAGDEGRATGFPGKLIELSRYGFDVRIDDFVIAYRDDRSIEQYYSTLTVIEDGEEVKQETIYVNRPLRHRGVNLYQSTYGWGVKVVFTNTETGQREEMLLADGHRGYYPDLGIYINILQFFPDFTMTREGMPASRSAYPANPEVAFQFLDHHGHVIGEQYYFEPLGREFELVDGYTMEFAGYQNYTGFQVIKQPGKPLALFASILLITGLFLCFYTYPRRVWIRQGEDGEGAALAAGVSYRNKVGFALEFEQITEQLKSLGGDQ